MQLRWTTLWLAIALSGCLATPEPRQLPLPDGLTAPDGAGDGGAGDALASDSQLGPDGAPAADSGGPDGAVVDAADGGDVGEGADVAPDAGGTIADATVDALADAAPDGAGGDDTSGDCGPGWLEAPPCAEGGPLAVAQVELADIDGDCALDLLVVDPDAAAVWLARGQSSGWFGCWNKVEAPNFLPLSVAVADFDGDGQAELVAQGSRFGSQGWVIGFDWAAPGAPTVAWSREISALLPGYVPSPGMYLWTEAVDLNGDDRADLAFGESYHANVLLSEGESWFGQGEAALLGLVPPGGQALFGEVKLAMGAPAGAGELLVAAKASVSSHVFGAGPVFELGLDYTVDNVSGLLAYGQCDLDGDGWAELLGVRDTPLVALRFRDGAMAKPPERFERALSLQFGLSYWTDVVCGQFDGVQGVDVVLAFGDSSSGSPSYLQAIRNVTLDQDGTLKSATSVNNFNFPGGYDAEFARGGDVDGDGRLDLVLVDRKAGLRIATLDESGKWKLRSGP
jgi:hypothetical protein